MNDCLWCMIFGDKKHPGECLSINSDEGNKYYKAYKKEVDAEVEKIRNRWENKLMRKQYLGYTIEEQSN